MLGTVLSIVSVEREYSSNQQLAFRHFTNLKGLEPVNCSGKFVMVNFHVKSKAECGTEQMDQRQSFFFKSPTVY